MKKIIAAILTTAMLATSAGATLADRNQPPHGRQAQPDPAVPARRRPSAERPGPAGSRQPAERPASADPGDQQSGQRQQMPGGNDQQNMQMPGDADQQNTQTPPEKAAEDQQQCTIT